MRRLANFLAITFLAVAVGLMLHLATGCKPPSRRPPLNTKPVPQKASVCNCAKWRDCTVDQTSDCKCGYDKNSVCGGSTSKPSKPSGSGY